MNPTTRWSGRTVVAGLCAATLSELALIWRGRHDTGSGAAPVNAVSHWIWPRRALRRDDVSMAHTGTGTAIHYGSSMLWAAVYALLRTRRRRPHAVNALTDAAAVTAMAAVVDLKLTPERFTPGFERRLSGASLVWVYGLFGAGLTVVGLALARRRR